MSAIASDCTCINWPIADSTVEESRIWNGTRIRERQCNKCGQKFATREVADAEARKLLTERRREYSRSVQGYYSLGGGRPQQQLVATP